MNSLATIPTRSLRELAHGWAGRCPFCNGEGLRVSALGRRAWHCIDCRRDGLTTWDEGTLRLEAWARKGGQ